MAHELDITNGQAAFVGREDAWHHLGVRLDRGFTAEEAMEHGLLGGWNVRKTPIFTRCENGLELPMPGRYATIRDNPVTRKPEAIGNVGEAYQVIQNEEHAALLNALVDESGAHFETAGALDGGKRVFITMKLPGHMKVGGQDQVDLYIAALNSHDGSSAFTFMVTPVRIVCQNTVNLAMSAAKNTFRIRHTSGAEKFMVNQARQALDITFDYLEDFQQEAEKLINTTMTQSAFEELVVREFGPDPDAPLATITRTENKIEEMFQLYSDAYTQEGIRDTAWAAVNALVEWNDHFAPVRAEDPDAARSARAVFQPQFKNKALELVRAEVGL